MPLIPKPAIGFDHEPKPSEDAQYYVASKVQSGYFNRRFQSGSVSWESNPEQVNTSFSTYKTYAEGLRFDLKPDLNDFTGIDWEAVVLKRESARGFGPDPISFAQLSNLLIMSFGLKEHGRWLKNIPAANSWPGRALPSGGGLYPLECYVLASTVGDLPPGLYHYCIPQGCLSQLRTDPGIFDFGSFWAQHTLFGRPAAVFFVTSIFAKSRIKYGARALRFILLEAGGVASHSNLVANAMGLDFCLDGGGYENKIEDLIRLNSRQEGHIITFMAGHKGS